MAVTNFLHAMEVSPKNALVADLRVYNHFYSSWLPIDPVKKVKVSSTMNLEVDTMTITLPAPHRLDNTLLGTRVKGAPIQLRINGVYWTGQVVKAVKNFADGRGEWQLTVHSDHKHLQRLLSRSPVTANASPTVSFKGSLGMAMRYLASQAVHRTGLPMYLTGDAEGDDVELAFQVDTPIDRVLSPAIDASGMLVDVRVIHPDQWRSDPNPGGKRTYLFAGAAEHDWFQEAVKQGVYADVPQSAKITTAPVGDPYTPHNAQIVVAGDSIPEHTRGNLGEEQVKATGDIRWVPFWIDMNRIPNPGYTSDSQWEIGKKKISEFQEQSSKENRVTTREKIREMVDSDYRLQWLGTHATCWEAGKFHDRDGFFGYEFVCHATGYLATVSDGEIIHIDKDSDLYGHLGGQPPKSKIWAWRDGLRWVVATDAELTNYVKRNELRNNQSVMPGVMVRLVKPRDRTKTIIFDTTKGSLPSWTATINAPEAAALVMGSQMDQFRAGLAQTALSNRAVFGVLGDLTPEQVAGKLPIADSAVKALGDAVKGVRVNSLPAATVNDSNLSFGSLSALMDMGQVGTLFYRESFYASGNGEWTSDATTGLEKAWSDVQGTTALTLEPDPNVFVFGDDVQVFPGRVISGWRPGDRVTFVDGDTRVTELITGWEAEWSESQPTPRVTPILGKPQAQQTPVDDFVRVVRRVEQLAGATAVAATGSKPQPVNMLQYRDVGLFGEN